MDPNKAKMRKMLLNCEYSVYANNIHFISFMDIFSLKVSFVRYCNAAYFRNMSILCCCSTFRSTFKDNIACMHTHQIMILLADQWFLRHKQELVTHHFLLFRLFFARPSSLQYAVERHFSTFSSYLQFSPTNRCVTRRSKPWRRQDKVYFCSFCKFTLTALLCVRNMILLFCLRI